MLYIDRTEIYLGRFLTWFRSQPTSGSDGTVLELKVSKIVLLKKALNFNRRYLENRTHWGYLFLQKSTQQAIPYGNRGFSTQKGMYLTGKKCIFKKEGVLFMRMCTYFDLFTLQSLLRRTNITNIDILYTDRSKIYRGTWWCHFWVRPMKCPDATVRKPDTDRRKQTKNWRFFKFVVIIKHV